LIYSTHFDLIQQFIKAKAAASRDRPNATIPSSWPCMLNIEQLSSCPRVNNSLTAEAISGDPYETETGV